VLEIAVVEDAVAVIAVVEVSVIVVATQVPAQTNCWLLSPPVPALPSP
jgi:hypothetical protein